MVAFNKALSMLCAIYSECIQIYIEYILKFITGMSLFFITFI